MKSISEKAEKHLDRLIERYPSLSTCRDSIELAFVSMVECFANDCKVLIAGNGGSSADSEHIVGELMKSFVLPRRISSELSEKLKGIDDLRGSMLAESLEQPLTAISLTTHSALSSAYINDSNSAAVFAQQLLGYGRPGDVFFAISTSGNSENVVNAAIVARALGIKVLALTGDNGGKLKEFADVIIRAPQTETYLVQEMHLPIYHCLCMMLETEFFG